MYATAGRRRKERGKKIGSTASTQGARGRRGCTDPAKAAVMAYVERLVRDGLACCAEMDNGATELTLASGEVLHLGKTSITRIV